ncbi:hypothetical protein IM816_10165 [Luteibacter flocculans]|uniref:PH domain-containing protein n=1 Tax=Luteibacter flocculans TaxID=2780091 RepID=A0ABY4SZN1_9GAMM|nr:hypothetical protein [Luteibacter flocculans]URL57028.1 hypothetical protein IM816_10165 [Luteibacter flocculans]
MATCTLDQWLYALRIAVEAANESLRRRRAMQYAVGDASGQALHVDVPRDASADSPLDSVVIPLRWFRDPHVPQVTELSVEFSCRLRYERGRGGEGGLIIDLHPPRPTWFRRRSLHRMRIAFRAADAWEPSVSIDERVALIPWRGRA